MEGVRVESEHVHKVYSQIAKHFSDTRYKPWPKIAQFLSEQPPGSVIADIGCGNGKYLGVNPHVFTLGCDICPELVTIAHGKSHEVAVCNCLNLPYRSDQFDAAICIAVIHHLSTEERRLRALRELARIVRPGGRLLVYVWALEQERRKFGSQDVMVPWHLQPKYADQEASRVKHRAPKPKKQRKKKDKRRGEGESYHSDSSEQQGLNCDAIHSGESGSTFLQDLLTVLASSGEEEEEEKEERERGNKRERGREMEKERERERTVNCTNVDKDKPQMDSSFTTSTTNGGCQGNDEREASKSAPAYTTTETISQPLPHPPSSTGVDSSLTVPEREMGTHQEHVRCESAATALPDPPHTSPDLSLEGLGYKTFQRYYHVFRGGELSTLVSMVTGLEVVEEFYDHENWCVVAGKVSHFHGNTE